MWIFLIPWLILSLAGVIAIVVLPESGPRLFSISEAHGPSAIDGVGILLLIAGWLVLVAGFWRHRRRIRSRLRPSTFGAGLYTSGLGSGLLVASVANDYAYWWIVGIVLLVLVQGGMVYLATSTREAPPNARQSHTAHCSPKG